jgi:hypothetical protein
MRTAALLALVVAALACGTEPPPSCGAPGLVRACACVGGAAGAQECSPGGAWSTCACGDAGVAADDGPPPSDAPAAADAVTDASEAAARPDGAADAPLCPAWWGECSPGACVPLASTAAHCGRCGAACSPSWRCERGTCVSPSGVTCDPGRADCDRNETNGCESALRVDHINCGDCGNDCTARGLFCREGACAP